MMRSPMRICPTRIRRNTDPEEEEEGLSLFVIRSQMKIRPTRIRRNTDPNHGRDECVASELAYLQRYCSVHLYHRVNIYQRAVNFITGAEPSGALRALFGSD